MTIAQLRDYLACFDGDMPVLIELSDETSVDVESVLVEGDYAYIKIAMGED